MSTGHCFLCLSDEGVFLNITPTNYNSLRGDVETFLSLKVEKSSNANKVCHKCAFELKQCSEFLKKYKESRATIGGTKSYRKNLCAFCLETGNKGYTFRLNRRPQSLNHPNDNLISNFQEHSQDSIFNNKAGIISICLTCRYSLDILFDLKSLYVELSEARSIFNKNSDYSTIPKVNTIMVKRKTTVPAYMRTRSCILSNTNSDSNKKEENSIVRMNKDESPQPKPRFCGSCKTNVKDGEDMYRFYKTGLTVCKTCWTNMDPSKLNKRKRKTQSDTKLCAVFLKDVLTNVPIKKEQKGYKVEKDSYGNNVYIITDSESDIEVEKTYKTDSDSREKHSKRLSTKLKRGQKLSQINVPSDSSDNETTSSKKMKIDTGKETIAKKTKVEDKKPKKKRFATSNHSDTDILSNISSKIIKTRGTKRKNQTEVYSLSDGAIRKSQRTKRNQSLKMLKEDDTSENDSSLPEDDAKEKKSNKPSTSHASNNITENNRKLRSDSASTSTIERTSLPTKKSVKSKKLFLETSSESVDLDEKINSNEKKDSSEKKDLSENKDSSEKQNSSEKKDSSKTKTYACRECGVKFESKLKVVTHELTHFKTLELKLNKLMIQDKIEDVKEKTDELNDELSEQQNEEINLSIDDDEELKTADVLDQTNVIEDTTEKEDMEMNLSFIENEEKNSLEVHDTAKRDLEESQLTETIEESTCKEPNLEVNKDEKKSSKCVVENEVSVIPTENNNTSKDGNKEQNDDPANNAIEDAEKSEEKKEEINEKTKDKAEKEVNENIEKTESNIDQSENNIKKKEKEKTMELEEQDKIIKNKEERDKIIDVEEERDKIIDVEEEKDKIMDVKEEKDKIIDVEEEKDKRINIEEEQDKIIDIEEKQDKIIGVEEEQDKIMEVEEEQDKIMEVEEEQDKIIDVGEEQDKIIDIEEKQDKIIGVEEEQDKIMEVEEEQDKIMEVEEEQDKIIDVGEEQDKIIDVGEEQDKIMEVEEENAKPKEDTIKKEENMIKDKEDNAKEIENNTNEQEEKMKEKSEDETKECDDKEEEKDIEITKEIQDETKEIEMSQIEKEEQNTVLNADNSKLNDRVHLNDIHTENLKQEEKENIENKKDDKNETDKDRKSETNKEVVNVVSLEVSAESNVPKSNRKSVKDDSDSVEEVVKQVDISKTTMIDSEGNKEHTNDAQKLLDDLTSSNESNSSNEISPIKKNNKESVNTAVEMVKHISNLATNEQQNSSSIIDDSSIRDSQLEAETLEDITLEIQKSADMPSLDPMNNMEIIF